MAVAVAMRNGWPARHPSPKNSPSPRMATIASLPSLGCYGELHLASSQVEHGIRRISLPEDGAVRAVFYNGFPAGDSSQEGFPIDRLSLLLFFIRTSVCFKPGATSTSWCYRVKLSRVVLPCVALCKNLASVAAKGRVNRINYISYACAVDDDEDLLKR